MTDSYHIPLIKENYYHIYNRGSNGALIFYEEKNYEYFLTKLNYYMHPYFDFFAYCLLPNHFHLLIKVKKEFHQFNSRSNNKSKPVSQSFSNFFNCYTKSINKKYNRNGNLFQRPFKRKAVYRDNYFESLICYIHRNPLHHNITNNLNGYKWSSYYQLINQKEQYIDISNLLIIFGSTENFIRIHEQWTIDYNQFKNDFE